MSRKNTHLANILLYIVKIVNSYIYKIYNTFSVYFAHIRVEKSVKNNKKAVRDKGHRLLWSSHKLGPAELAVVPRIAIHQCEIFLTVGADGGGGQKRQQIQSGRLINFFHM